MSGWPEDRTLKDASFTCLSRLSGSNHSVVACNAKLMAGDSTTHGRFHIESSRPFPKPNDMREWRAASQTMCVYRGRGPSGAPFVPEKTVLDTALKFPMARNQ